MTVGRKNSEQAAQAGTVRLQNINKRHGGLAWRLAADGRRARQPLRPFFSGDTATATTKQAHAAGTAVKNARNPHHSTTYLAVTTSVIFSCALFLSRRTRHLNSAISLQRH